MSFKTVYIILLFILFVFNTKGQHGRNHINIHYGLMYYPDWKFNSKCLGFSYSHDLKEKYILEFGMYHTEFYPLLAGKITPTTEDYGITIDRVLNGFDCKLGYKLWQTINKNINFTASSGLSFIWGDEQILSYVRYGPPFNEIGTTPFFRHHPGLNLGMNFKCYPVSFLELSTSVTGRVYVKGQPDLTLAINAGFNFSR